MDAEARIFVLVEVRAVEVNEAMLVGGEVRGDPVEDHAETLLMQLIDDYMRSCGVPKREVGAKNPVTWYPQDG